MRKALFVAAACVALSSAAAADPKDGERVEQREVVVVHNGPGLFEHPKIDANGDGFLSRDEVRADAEALFAKLDRNSDGKLNAADHDDLAADAKAKADKGKKRIEQSLEQSNVVIVRKEGGGAFSWSQDGGPRPPRPPFPMAVMALASSEEADLNQDGALSKDEFVNQQMRFFDAADANNDGKVKAPQMHFRQFHGAGHGPGHGQKPPK